MGLYVNIRKQLGNFSLDVEFTAKEGVFAFLGASGCGKSMTLKCIAGIEKPDYGRIVLGDRVLFDSAQKINLPPQKRKVGYMFQDYALFPNMTVEKNIASGMGRNPDAKAVENYMEKFQLSGLERLYPEQLSGGQKQRVALARMIAAQPEVFLLDEPFAALDSYLRGQLEQQTAQTLKEAKKPAIFVSHDADEVYRLSDTVACMNHGRIEVIDPVEEFFQNPKTEMAAILSGRRNPDMKIWRPDPYV